MREGEKTNVHRGNHSIRLCVLGTVWVRVEEPR